MLGWAQRLGGSNDEVFWEPLLSGPSALGFLFPEPWVSSFTSAPASCCLPCTSLLYLGALICPSNVPSEVFLDVPLPSPSRVRPQDS